VLVTKYRKMELLGRTRNRTAQVKRSEQNQQNTVSWKTINQRKFCQHIYYFFFQ